MLRETQSLFATSLLSLEASATHAGAALVRAGKLTAARRQEIYRFNVLTNLSGALKGIYPVVLAVVGEAFFQHAAEQFIRAHPSHSGDLNRFGTQWPTFLVTYLHAAQLPYLCDVATLEWAWHEAFHAADAPPFDLQQLAEVPPEKHGALRFALHPSARLIQSNFPILQIWEVNQPGFAGEMAVVWDVPTESLLVHRDAIDGVSVIIERVGEAGYAFLRALAWHENLENAALAAHSIDAAFDLQGFLLQSVQSGSIIDFIRDQP
ncbi:MAG: DNA-binding domain-containing protein [Betaproteobacteria bacterium]